MSLETRVQQRVQAAVTSGALTLESDVAQTPFVGPTLRRSMAEKVLRDAASALPLRRVRDFLLRRPRSAAAIESRLQDLCRNPRGNRCAQGYHVRDVNRGCALALADTFKRLLRSMPTFGGAIRAALNRVKRAARARRVAAAGFSPAAGCGCLAGPACAAQPGCERLASGACVPAGDEAGFEGWRPFTGQSFSRAAQRRVRPYLEARAVGLAAVRLDVDACLRRRARGPQKAAAAHSEIAPADHGEPIAICAFRHDVSQLNIPGAIHVDAVATRLREP